MPDSSPSPESPRPASKLTPGRLALALLMLVILGASYWLGRTPPPAPAPPAPPPPPEAARPDLTLRDGQLFRTAETNHPFNGFLIERYPDGVMKSRSAISNGYLEGLSLGWYTNKQMQVQEQFVKSISHGLRTQWHPNGVKKSAAQITNGKLHGTFRRWDEQGKLAEEIELKEGVPHGISRSWFPSGCAKSWVRMDAGKVAEQKSWEDGATRDFSAPASAKP